MDPMASSMLLVLMPENCKKGPGNRRSASQRRWFSSISIDFRMVVENAHAALEAAAESSDLGLSKCHAVEFLYGCICRNCTRMDFGVTLQVTGLTESFSAETPKRFFTSMDPAHIATVNTIIETAGTVIAKCSSAKL